MINLALLDTVMDIIRHVPDAHNQETYCSSLFEDERSAVHVELLSRPDLAAIVDCGTAACVGGWALIVKGYRPDGRHFTYPPGHVLPDGTSVGGQILWGSIGVEAATVLGLPYDEVVGNLLSRGLFWARNTVDDLEDWCAYYHGQLPQDELYHRLTERRLERDGEWAPSGAGE